MNWSEFVDAVARRWKAPLVGLLLGLLGGSSVLLMVEPVYESSTRLFLATPGWGGPTTLGNSDSSPYQGDEFGRQRAQTYVRLAEDTDFARRVSERMGGAATPDDVSAHLDVRVVPDTVLLEVTAGDPSPERAREIAASAADQMTADIETLETPSGLLVPTVRPIGVGSATSPTEPAFPAVIPVLLTSGTLGLLIGLSVVVVQVRIRRTLDDVDELAAATGVTVVGDGASPPDAADCDALRYGLEYLGPRIGSGVVAVVGGGASIGRSSMSRGLCDAYRRAGRTALVVDADFRRATSSSTSGLSDVVLGHVGAAQTVVRTACCPTVPSGSHPAEPARLLEHPRFAGVLSELAGSYDLVIVDTPDLRRFDDARTVARLADAVILVVAAGTTTADDVKGDVLALDAVGVRVGAAILTRNGRVRRRRGHVQPPALSTPSRARTGTMTR